MKLQIPIEWKDGLNATYQVAKIPMGQDAHIRLSADGTYYSISYELRGHGHDMSLSRITQDITRIQSDEPLHLEALTAEETLTMTKAAAEEKLAEIMGGEVVK